MARFARLGRALENILEKHPFLANSSLAFILDGTGDVLSQSIQKSRALQYDQDGNVKGEFGWKRTLNFSLYGAIVGAPTEVVWYGVLDSAYVRQGIARSIGTSHVSYSIGQTLLDAVIYAPFSAIVFSGCMHVLRERCFDNLAAWKHAKDQFAMVFGAELLFWIPFQLANFAFVPRMYRVLAHNCGCVCFSCILSCIEFSDNTNDMLHSGEGADQPNDPKKTRQKGTQRIVVSGKQYNSSFRICFEVRSSPGKGNGVFATEKIKKGTVIFSEADVKEKEMTQEEAVAMLKNIPRDEARDVLSHSYVREDGVFAWCQDAAALLNHSSKPNIMPTGPLGDPSTYWVACQDIGKGEEITCNYSPLFSSEPSYYKELYTDILQEEYPDHTKWD